MRAEDAPIGSLITFNASVHPAWIVGKYKDTMVVGWKPNELTGSGWYMSKTSTDPAEQYATKILTQFGCERGWWVDINDEVTIVIQAPKTSAKVSSVGLYCKLCQDYASHAEPNRPDGSFICYSCRSGWVPQGL